MMCKLIKWSEFDQLISTRDGRHKEEWATSLVVDVSGNMYIFHISLAPDVCPLLGILQLNSICMKAAQVAQAKHTLNFLYTVHVV